MERPLRAGGRGLQRAAPRDGARRARGRGEAAGHGVQGPARQRRQVPAQQGPHGPAREGGGERGRLPSADERGEELQPSVRQRAAAGGRGLHDRPQHGGPGDPAEAGAAGAAGQRQRGGPADETQAGGCEAAGRLPDASEAQDHRLAFEHDFFRHASGLRISADPFWRKKRLITLRRNCHRAKTLEKMVSRHCAGWGGIPGACSAPFLGLGCSENQRVGRTDQTGMGKPRKTVQKLFL